MEELKVVQQAGVINTNLDSIEAEIKEQMAEYKDYVVTEDSVKTDKKVLADLRKLEKDLNKARIATKKEYMKAFDEFEGRCKSVIALVSEPINLINSQIELFDEEKKLEKVKHIKELYADNIKDLEKFLPFEKVMKANPKWTNASTKDSDILFDLNGMILKIKNDLTAIHALNSEIEQECIDTYANFGNDLSMAIQRNSQYIADKHKIEQAQKEAIEQATNDNRQAETKVETKEPEVETKEVTENVVEEVKTATENVSPLEGTNLDEMVQKTKTAKIIVSLEDLEQVKQTLNFMGISFRVEQ